MKSYRKSLTPLGINTRPSNLFVDAGQLNISQPYNNLLAAPANYGVTVNQPNINNLNTSSLGSMVANNMAKLGNSRASGKSGSGFLGLKGASTSTITDKAGAGIAGIEALAQNFQKPVFDTETAGKAANAAAATQDTGAGASDSTSLMNAWNSIGFAKDNYTKRDIDKQTGFQKGLGVFNSTASGASAGMSIGGPWGALIGGVAGLGSGLYGMFNRGAQAKKAAKRLNAQADTVNSNLLAGFNNNATNLDISAGQNMLANYSAYGGGLNVLDNQPYYADGGILEGDYDVDNITPEQIMELKRRGYNVDIEDNSFPNGGYVTNQYTADRDVTNVNHQIPALSLLKDRPYIDNQNSIGYSNPYYAKYRNSAVSDKPTATQASQTYWSPVKGAGKRFAASIKSHTNPVNGLLNTVVPAASMAAIPMSLAVNIPTLVGGIAGGAVVDELTGGWGKYLEDKTGMPSELGELTNPGYLIGGNAGRIGRNIYHRNLISFDNIPPLGYMDKKKRIMSFASHILTDKKLPTFNIDKRKYPAWVYENDAFNPESDFSRLYPAQLDKDFLDNRLGGFSKYLKLGKDVTGLEDRYIPNSNGNTYHYNPNILLDPPEMQNLGDEETFSEYIRNSLYQSKANDITEVFNGGPSRKVVTGDFLTGNGGNVQIEYSRDPATGLVKGVMKDRWDVKPNIRNDSKPASDIYHNILTGLHKKLYINYDNKWLNSDNPVKRTLAKTYSNLENRTINHARFSYPKPVQWVDNMIDKARQLEAGPILGGHPFDLEHTFYIDPEDYLKYQGMPFRTDGVYKNDSGTLIPKNNYKDGGNIYTDGGNTVPYYLAARTSPNNLPEVTVTKRVPKFISDKDKNTYYNIYGNQGEKTAKAWYDTKYGVSQGLNDFGKTWVTPAVMASLPLGEAFSAASKPISAAYNSGKIGARINEAFDATLPGAYIDAASQMTGLGNKYSLFAPAMKGVNTLKEAATTPYTYLAPKTMAGNIANAATMAGMTYGVVKPAMDNLNVGTGTEAALAVAPLLFGSGKIKMPRAIAHQYYNLRRKYPAVFYNDEGLTRKSKVYGNLSDLASTNSKRDRLNVTNMLTKEGNNILLNTYNQFNDLYKSTGRPVFDPHNYSIGYGYKPILLPSKIASSEPNIINENTPVSFHNPITNTTANGHISTDFLNNTTESQRDLNINFDAVAFRDKMNSGSPLNFLLWDIPELFPNINYRAHKTGTKFPVAYPDKGFEPVRDEINSYYNTMLSKIGDDAIPTGSMVAVNKGYLNRVPGDLDLITTNDRVGSLMNKLNGKTTGEKREGGSGSLLGYTAQSPYYLGDGNGELEVINESNGKASGKIAHELYGILHPEEEAALQKQNALSKNPYYSDELPLPISAEELYQEAKLNKANERKIIQDRQSSYVDKHVEGNQQYIFSDQVPASVYTSNLRDNMTKNVGKGFKMLKDVSPDIDYTNIKENSALLKYLNIPDKDNIIAGNPNTMEKITETLHAEHTLPTRSIDRTKLLPGSTIEDAFTGVNSPKGVNGAGIGSNRIIVNNSSDKWNGGRGAGNSYGDEVGVSQFPLVNDYSKVKYPSDLINGIERRKFPKEIGLTDDEITELEKVMTQNNISIPVKLNTLQDAYNVMREVDKTPKSEPVNRAFGKILGISGYRGSEYESGLGDYFGGITYDNYPLGIKHGGNYEIPTSINKLSYKNGIDELISTPITAAEARNYAKETANMPGQPSEDYNDLTKLLDFIESTEPSKERVNLFRDFDQNIYFHDPNSESQLEYKDLYNRLFNNDNISPSIKNIKEKVDSMVDRDNVSTKYRNESSKYKSLKEKRAKVLNNSISVLGGTVGTTGVAAIPISMVIMAGSHHPNREENEPVHNYTSENIEQFNKSLQDVTDDTFRNSKKHTKYSFTKKINKRKHK